MKFAKNDQPDETAQKLLNDLPEYLAVVETLRPLKRPMLLWCAVSLAYVYGGLNLEFSGNAALGIIKITGTTEWKLTLFLFLSTLYYTARWVWTNWLNLRAYWRDGFIGALWRTIKTPHLTSAAQECFNVGQGFNEVAQDNADSQEVNQAINTITSDRTIRGTVEDLTGFGTVSRFVKRMELFNLPYIFPFLIALVALGGLLFRLLTPEAQ